ncbi:MAG: SEC-C metal-binding domain-containing protein [Myxococcales bacterium]
MPKVGRNDPCWCPSGKKYKRCHEAFDRGLGPVEVELTGGRKVLMSPPKIEVKFRRDELSGVPSWLLRHAIRTARDAAGENTDDYHCIVALLFLSMAAEAVVNRLLEPLMGRRWDDRFERRTALVEKWKCLYKELGLPKLDKAREPLSTFAAMVDVRNELVHFKHGKNVTRIEQTVNFERSYGNLTVNLHKPEGPAVITQTPQFPEHLRPSDVAHWEGGLRVLLGPVLEKYPEDVFGEVGALRAALAG